jgi:uncharacterized RDD family membrane protein YckC
LSTSVLYPNSAVSWKQEVNQRLAAHRLRRGFSVAQPDAPAPSWTAVGSRGAQVAARVAARYAHAPSYSQLQGEETPPAARVRQSLRQSAVPAAKVEARERQSPTVRSLPVKESKDAVPAGQATTMRQSAHASAARPALEPVRVPDAAPVPAAPPHWEPEYAPAAAFAHSSAPPHESAKPMAALFTLPQQPPASLDAWENEYSRNRWEPDIRLRPVEAVVLRAPQAVEEFAAPTHSVHERPNLRDEFFGESSLEPVEPDQPIHANLIEFPRELVAPRKMRPRRAERTGADEGLDRQLSIFEVDPGLDAPRFELGGAAAKWQEPEWSELKLEAQIDVQSEPEVGPEAEVYLAPVGHRMMAVLVDGALIAGAFVALALVAALSMGAMPSARVAEVGAVFGVLLVGLLYQILFLTLAEATPGMRYAGISLCTFDGQVPTVKQLRSRMGALLLSVASMGLGLAWAFLDDEHLCWHDRLSRTYLRKD